MAELRTWVAFGPCCFIWRRGGAWDRETIRRDPPWPPLTKGGKEIWRTRENRWNARPSPRPSPRGRGKISVLKLLLFRFPGGMVRKGDAGNTTEMLHQRSVDLH